MFNGHVVVDYAAIKLCSRQRMDVSLEDSELALVDGLGDPRVDTWVLERLASHERCDRADGEEDGGEHRAHERSTSSTREDEQESDTQKKSIHQTKVFAFAC